MVGNPIKGTFAGGGGLGVQIAGIRRRRRTRFWYDIPKAMSDKLRSLPTLGALADIGQGGRTYSRSGSFADLQFPF